MRRTDTGTYRIEALWSGDQGAKIWLWLSEGALMIGGSGLGPIALGSLPQEANGDIRERRPVSMGMGEGQTCPLRRCDVAVPMEGKAMLQEVPEDQSIFHPFFLWERWRRGQSPGPARRPCQQPVRG